MPAMPAERRILVVDDDEVLRSLLDALLSAEGHTVTLADSGAAGVQALEQKLMVDIVLTDLQMPGLGGEALATALRSAMPETAVLLAMSGTAPDEATRTWFDGFLAKPFDPASLLQAERDALARRTPPAAPAEVGRETEAAGPALDQTIFDSLARVIPLEKLGELYEMTLADILKRHARMEAAAAEGNLLTVKQEAHATKGACGMVGAQELQQIAAKIEDSPEINAWDLAKIPAACSRLRRMLDAALK